MSPRRCPRAQIRLGVGLESGRWNGVGQFAVGDPTGIQLRPYLHQHPRQEIHWQRIEISFIKNLEFEISFFRFQFQSLDRRHVSISEQASATRLEVFGQSVEQRVHQCEARIVERMIGRFGHRTIFPRRIGKDQVESLIIVDLGECAGGFL